MLGEGVGRGEGLRITDRAALFASVRGLLRIAVPGALPTVIMGRITHCCAWCAAKSDNGAYYALLCLVRCQH